jgi:hypothetical protein|nr:MAG TPA_asm: hypothetical protein [Caudoviricetes sp.]
MIKLWNKNETLQRVCEDTSKVNELRKTYCEQLNRNEKESEHAKDYNRLLENYKTLKAHYIELNKECKELQEENISLLIHRKSSERTKNMILDEVQQLHDRVMKLIAEEMNEDD